MKLGYGYKSLGAVLAAIGVAMAAVGFFQVRELLAELFLFTILFVAVGLCLSILFLIQKGAHIGVTRLEAGVAYVRASHPGASVRPGKDHALRGSRWN